MAIKRLYRIVRLTGSKRPGNYEGKKRKYKSKKTQVISPLKIGRCTVRLKSWTLRDGGGLEGYQASHLQLQMKTGRLRLIYTTSAVS